MDIQKQNKKREGRTGQMRKKRNIEICLKKKGCVHNMPPFPKVAHVSAARVSET